MKTEQAALTRGLVVLGKEFCNVRIVPPGAKHYGLGSCQVAPITDSDSWHVGMDDFVPDGTIHTWQPGRLPRLFSQFNLDSAQPPYLRLASFAQPAMPRSSRFMVARVTHTYCHLIHVCHACHEIHISCARNNLSTSLARVALTDSVP